MHISMHIPAVIASSVALPPGRGRPTYRRGISLIEVLISMFVLLIGLMGVAAMFPVGSYYMVKGEQLDRGAAVAQAATHEMVTRGFLAPQTWLRIDPDGPPNDPFVPVFPVYPPPGPLLPPPAVGIVIDPLGIAEARQQGTQQLADAAIFPRDDAPSIGSPLRVTLPAAGRAMQLPIADLVFRSRDDLTFSLPDQSDLPARSLFEGTTVDETIVPLRRQTQGEYSWLVTIGPRYAFEPKYDLYRKTNSPDILVRNYLATARDPTFKHKVSVVVFHRRNLLFPTGSGAETELSERQVVAEILSPGGPNGGEVRLRTNDPRELNGMRTGEWVMMFGQYPVDPGLHPSRRRWFLEWYRIVGLDLGFEDAPESVDEGTRFVSLKGPPWPYSQQDYQRMASGEVDAELLPRVGLVSGAISVHTKTMRLESPSAWAAQ